ncbi:non-ribosomal peptide synthetase [Micromonospora parathelypteridis]|uniref:Amino acid adenylation domain-containing protein n=1 Tax=Micromonospora parathelypteridis TaxID=1839617 RepID=A0A840VVZ6_9ACTN|nr:non-ribosomal peptide synthetase [Micromonospora parathelypteridis]MBB5480797.1 amino acid adenylation domain-containing protein [Micromonospora parathelypteridis]
MSDNTSSVSGLFHAQAARTPDLKAVVDGKVELSYRQLSAYAARLSRRLLALGIGRGDLVGLRAGHSADTIVAMLGILGAGAAYVPLEGRLPAERVRRMAADARVRAVLTVPPLDWGLSDLPTLTYSLRDPDATVGSAVPPPVEVTGDDLLYVPYTSGSTGRPKGVEVPHRSVPGFYIDEDYGPWRPGLRAMCHSAMSWDGHVFEVYPVLTTGGTLVIHRGDDGSDPLAVADAAQRAGADMLMLPTQAFNTVAAERPGLLAGLRCLVIGGEVASRDHLGKVLANQPDLTIVNVYGPVECTCLAIAHQITAADLALPAIPIGRSIGDRTVHLLDEEHRPVPDGVVGEVYIGGPAVARGYLGQPGLTAERFGPDPFGPDPGGRLYRTGDLARRVAGVYDFVGRADDQVKLRGFRIELGEIDIQLRAHPAVTDAATVALAEDNGLRLVSYVVPDGPHVTSLREHLRRVLPEAMVPAAVVGLDAFPLTHSGKLDRQALPAPPVTAAGGGDRPASSTEKNLAGLWQALLGLDEVAREDDFFVLGGHSLLATRLALRVREAFAVPITVRDIYDQPLLRELALLVDERRATSAAA